VLAKVISDSCQTICLKEPLNAVVMAIKTHEIC